MKNSRWSEVISLSGATFLSAAIFGVFWVFLASVLEPEEYGEIGFLFSIAQVTFTFALVGLSRTVVVYESKGENVFPISMIIVLVTSTVSAVISYILTQNIFVSILVVGFAIFSMIMSPLTAYEKYNKISMYRILRASGSVVLALLLYYFLGINGILLGYFIATLFIIKELAPLLKDKRVDFTVLKSKVNFLIPAYAERLSDIFVRWGDKLIIGSLFGMLLLGNYYFAVQFFFLIYAIPRGVITYLIPQESRGRSNKKLKVFAIFVSCIIAIISILLIPLTVNTFLPKYYESILPIQILSIAIIPAMIDSIQLSEFLGREQSRIVLVSRITQSILYLVLIIWLGTEYGINGLAVGFLISIIVKTLVNFYMRSYNQSKKAEF